MNVLIVGNNGINEEIEKNILKEGMSATTISNVGDIVRFKGEPGNYTVTTPSEKLSVASVIITEPPDYGALSVGDGNTHSILDAEAIEKLKALKTHDKIVFLLDYSEETPEFAATKAMEAAKQLVDRKKQVVFLSKFVKCSSEGMEALYREARMAGVSFIKYETAEITYNEDTGRFKIKANDGVFVTNVETPHVVSIQKKDTGELAAISKKLKLYYKTADGLNNDRFFLYPVFSTRRGIYYINPALLAPDTKKSVQNAIPAIINDMSAIASKSYVREIVREQSFPVVDEAKCAFCYSCHRACPHGALEPDIEASAMKVIESECQACGICVGICPGEAISRKDVKKDETKGCPGRMKLFCCENGALQAYREIEPRLGYAAALIKAEPVACGGSVSADMIATALSTYGKVMVACCADGACRHIDGGKRACKQTERAAALFEKAELNGKKVKFVKLSNAMPNVLKENIISLMEG